MFIYGDFWGVASDFWACDKSHICRLRPLRSHLLPVPINLFETFKNNWSGLWLLSKSRKKCNTLSENRALSNQFVS